MSFLEKDLEEAAYRIIAFAGEARGKAFGALDCYEKGELDKIDKSLKESSELICEANKALFKLIQREARGEKITFSILLVHAIDIMMASVIEKELIERFIKINKTSKKEGKS